MKKLRSEKGQLYREFYCQENTPSPVVGYRSIARGHTPHIFLAFCIDLYMCTSVQEKKEKKRKINRKRHSLWVSHRFHYRTEKSTSSERERKKDVLDRSIHQWSNNLIGPAIKNYCNNVAWNCCARIFTIWPRRWGADILTLTFVVIAICHSFSL